VAQAWLPAEQQADFRLLPVFRAEGQCILSSGNMSDSRVSCCERSAITSPSYKAAPDRSGSTQDARGRFIDRSSVAGRLHRPAFGPALQFLNERYSTPHTSPLTPRLDVWYTPQHKPRTSGAHYLLRAARLEGQQHRTEQDSLLRRDDVCSQR
jgi:hypothetical protein